MYNPELKSAFITQNSDSITVRKNCVLTFNSCAPFEEQWGADICTQTEETLAPVVSKLLGLRVISIENRARIFQKYGQWCLDNHVPGACDGLLNVQYYSLDKVRSQTVKNPLQLAEYLDAILPPASDQGYTNVIRCFFWLAFGGMKEEDTMLVNCSDVDLDRMVVSFCGDDYPIYREAVPAFKNCSTLTAFTYFHSGHNIYIRRERMPGNRLLRGVGETPSLGRIRTNIARYKAIAAKNEVDTMGLRLTYGKVWMSGVFYRTYEKELIGIRPDFMPLVLKISGGKEYNLSSGRNKVGATYRAIAKDYMTDYKRWKATLNDTLQT